MTSQEDGGRLDPDPEDGLRIVSGPGGVTIVQGDAVLSRVLDHPGPTHGYFDVIAAAIAALDRGGSILVLGFAGGGIVAPLRAMGVAQPIEAVDLSLVGERVFARLSSGWCGEVAVHQAEAVAWLSATRRTFDLILEDLSIDEAGIVVKPEISATVLPRLISRRLRPGGAAVFNLLGTQGTTWRSQVEAIRSRFAATLVVLEKEYQNRLVIGSEALPTARELSTRLRELLAAIRSRRARAPRVRSLEHGDKALYR